MHSSFSAQTGSCTGVIGRYHSSEAATERSGAKLTLQLHNWGRKNGRGSLAERRLRYIVWYCRAKSGASASKQLAVFLTPRRGASLDLLAPKMVYDLVNHFPIDLFK